MSNPLAYFQWNPKEFARFKRAYNRCKRKVFIFQGQKVIKDYAKYLIEAVETLPKEPNPQAN